MAGTLSECLDMALESYRVLLMLHNQTSIKHSHWIKLSDVKGHPNAQYFKPHKMECKFQL